MTVIKITKEEKRAIDDLKNLAKRWPKTISLFSWSGSLNVMKRLDDDRLGVVAKISGIDNDGGDPSDDEVDQCCQIEWD